MVNAALMISLAVSFGWADGAAAELDAAVRDKANASFERGIDYLRKNQNEDGSFAQGDLAPAITALVVTGALRSKRVGVTDPLAAKGLAFVEKFVQPDGGIYVPGRIMTYSTAVAVMALAEANGNGKYQATIDGAVAYLKKDQFDESEDVNKSDPKFGGTGYGNGSRPDLSNTAFLLEALKAANLPADDPAYQRAVLFVTRCQNLSGEGANDLPIGAKINEGGFFYTPIASKRDNEPKSDNEGLRSYGSMTYSGLKSFLYAGVDKSDRRVKAAVDWIQKHYSLSENPGQGTAGLFYYYHTFSKALHALGMEELVDAAGKPHRWRVDLIEELSRRQNADGSWTNADRRFLENDPKMVTGFALICLSFAIAK